MTACRRGMQILPSSVVSLRMCTISILARYAHKSTIACQGSMRARSHLHAKLIVSTYRQIYQHCLDGENPALILHCEHAHARTGLKGPKPREHGSPLHAAGASIPCSITGGVSAGSDHPWAESVTFEFGWEGVERYSVFRRLRRICVRGSDLLVFVWEARIEA